MSGTDETVPFGKYKGRPVADMLADADYMGWLEAQPWFRERFSRLLANRDAEAASRTPVHNRLQALFLDPSYCKAFVNVANPAKLEAHIKYTRQGLGYTKRKLAELLEAINKGFEWEREREKSVTAEEIASRLAMLNFNKPIVEAALHKAEAGALILPKAVFSASFEVKGCDVGLHWEITWGEYQVNSYAYSREPIEIFPQQLRDGVGIEIKPTVADEYPAVLRQMARNKSDYLFLDRYEGEGVTEAQFCSIFQASGKGVVFKRDVDAQAGLAP